MITTKIFDKWDPSNVEVRDVGLKRYISLKPIVVPHTSGRHARKRFSKADVSIVERLINNMMRTEFATGEKHKAYNIMKKTFEIVNQKTKKNPIQVLINAIENAAPREETTRLKYGGITYHTAVDVAPQRRVDFALRLIAQAASQATFKNPKPIYECLAEEIIASANNDPKSKAILKKDEIERIAQSSR
ncbi:MAG: 30S ribosomal protein S7 [Euryarchaeota archaeon]|nr:30S ribosomal protein S7 [Euryarchaeota archaeon]